MISIPENKDTDSLPEIDQFVKCNNCGGQCELKNCDCVDFNDVHGHERFRIRAAYLCPTCLNYRVFRLSAMHVEDGKLVNSMDF